MARKIETTHRVRVLRDIRRKEDPSYARAGQEGEVTETFRPPSSACGERGPWYAKVRMGDGTIKTFRLTSLERVPA